MKIYRFVFVLTITAAIMINQRAAASDIPGLEQQHRFEMPFLDKGKNIWNGWLGFDPQGGLLAAYYTIAGEAYVAIWQVQSGKLLDKIEVGKGFIKSDYGAPAEFTSTTKHLAYMIPGEVIFHPLKAGEVIQRCALPKRKELDDLGSTAMRLINDKEVEQFMYSPSNGTFWCDRCAIGNPPKMTKTREFTLPRALGSLISPDRTTIAWLPGKDLLNPVPETCSINLLNVSDGKISKMSRDGVGCTSIGFSQDGALVAAGSRDGSLTIWNITKSAQVYTIPPPKEGRSVSSIAFSPDGKWVGYSSLDAKGKSNIRIAEVKTGNIIWTWADSQTSAFYLSWNSKSTQLAVLGGGSVTIYNVPELKK